MFCPKAKVLHKLYLNIRKNKKIKLTLEKKLIITQNYILQCKLTANTNLFYSKFDWKYLYEVPKWVKFDWKYLYEVPINEYGIREFITKPEQ